MGQQTPIGFVLLSFNLPEQTIHLCRRLTEMFGPVPIALHHDFGQCDLDRSQLPSGVHLVTPSLATKWGTFPVVEANLAALRLLYTVANPDWCVSLSTADYPVKSAHRILADLAATPYDAFLDHRLVVNQASDATQPRDQSKAFADPAWVTLAYKRYVALNLNPDRLTWRFPSLHRDRIVRGRLVERLFTPFGKRFRPYAGDAWYTLNRRAASLLAAETAQLSRLRRHYRNRRVPEESIYQTILCNHSELAICPDNLRYTDWRQGGTSPKYLEACDIPAMIASQAHFARKFAFSEPLFAQVDKAVQEAEQEFIAR